MNLVNDQSFPWLRNVQAFAGALVFLVLSAITGIATPPTDWVQLFPATSPTPRSYVAMCYDAISQKVVLFGGLDDTSYLNDTWTFDGTTWTKVNTPIAPPARTNAQMAYDRHVHQLVLFGGYDGRHYLSDTWLWDGATGTWTEANPAHSPKAVTGPMVFPDPNGRVDEFGGFDGQFYQLTMWQWTGVDWQQLHPSVVPYARSSAAVGTDRWHRRVVMFGGLSDLNPINTWTYDGTNWTMTSPETQPEWVYGPSTIFDPNLHAVVLFGGGSGGIAQDASWAWTGTNWIALTPTHSPPAREGAGIAYDLVTGRVFLFGGQDGSTLLNDIWELRP